MQKLLVELLLINQKYEQLVYLVHNDVIKDSEDLSSKLVMEGIERNELMLLTLGLDMGHRVSKPPFVL